MSRGLVETMGEGVRRWFGRRTFLASRQPSIKCASGRVELTQGRTLTAAQFRQRTSQILKSFSEQPTAGGKSRLEKLIDGMPKRLALCKANNYGKCGK